MALELHLRPMQFLVIWASHSGGTGWNDSPVKKLNVARKMNRKKVIVPRLKISSEVVYLCTVYTKRVKSSYNTSQNR